MAPIIIVALVLIALYAGTKRLSGVQILGVTALALLGITFVVLPSLSTKVANFLGVGRGTDLIFYLAILGGLFVASNFYFRFKRQEEALVALARQSAIDHAHQPTVSTTISSGPLGDRPIQKIEKDLNRIEP